MMDHEEYLHLRIENSQYQNQNHRVIINLEETSPYAASTAGLKSKKISNDQELIQSDPTSCPQNQKGNN